MRQLIGRVCFLSGFVVFGFGLGGIAFDPGPGTDHLITMALGGNGRVGEHAGGRPVSAPKADLLYGEPKSSTVCYLCQGMGTRIVRGKLEKCRTCAGTGRLES